MLPALGKTFRPDQLFGRLRRSSAPHKIYSYRLMLLVFSNIHNAKYKRKIYYTNGKLRFPTKKTTVLVPYEFFRPLFVLQPKFSAAWQHCFERKNIAIILSKFCTIPYCNISIMPVSNGEAWSVFYCCYSMIKCLLYISGQVFLRCSTLCRGQQCAAAVRSSHLTFSSQQVG
jgi:hypothetical protein